MAALLVALSYPGAQSDRKDVAAPTATSSVSSPSAPASPVPTIPPVSSPTVSATPPSSTQPASPTLKAIVPAKPTKLAIPAIGVVAYFGTPIVSAHDADGWTITPPEATWEDLQQVYWWSESQYSALPGNPSKGSTFVYGHACFSASCAFNKLKDLTAGDLIKVTTSSGVLTYRVTQGPLKLDKSPQGVGASKALYTYGIPNELRLVTCGYTPEGASPFNWAVIARLQPRGPP